MRLMVSGGVEPDKIIVKEAFLKPPKSSSEGCSGMRNGKGVRSEKRKGDKRSIKEAKGRALERDATARRLLSPHVGSYDWCSGMGFG